MEGDGEYPRYLLGNPLAPFPRLQDGEADGGIWTDDQLFDFGNSFVHGVAEDPLDFSSLLDDDALLLGANKQLDADSSAVNHALPADAHSSRTEGYLQQQPVPGAGTCRGGDASLEQQRPVALAPSHATIQAGFYSLDPAADMLTTTTTGPDDDDEMEFAEMARVAARCGEDEERTRWSHEEHRELLARLDLYAEEDAVTRCFKIAFHLPKKTALDVALRCRWLQDKRETAESARKGGARGKLIKVQQGTKIAKINNKIYPLSKEALNSKSSKELIEDNNMFFKRIEENIKTGQVGSTADYFYYVKTNMDAIQERGRRSGISMAMPPIDEQGLGEILRDRLNFKA